MTKALPEGRFRPVVVLRYHDYFNVVLQRIRLLRELNPGISIHGLQGSRHVAPPALTAQLDSNTKLDLLPELAWRNMDLSLVEWFRRFNVRKWEVEPRMVAAAAREGQTTFHPVRKLLDERLIKRVISRYNTRDSAPFVTGS